jgi:large subunit ribosomal protein L4
MRLPLRDAEGADKGEIEVKDSVFAATVNEALLHQAVMILDGNRRQGTRSTKTRGLVRGGGRKPWRQKGTGRARQGSIRSPLWRKGGVAFGPLPKDYRRRLPKRMRRLAVVSALSAKARDGEIVVLESLSLSQPRTKTMRKALESLGAPKALVLTAEQDTVVWKSIRNLPGSDSLVATEATVRDLLKYPKLVLTVESVRALEEVLG